MIRGKREFVAKVLFKTWVYRGLKYFDSRNLVIFNYHRIRGNSPTDTRFDDAVYGPTQEELSAQFQWMKLNCNVISEADLIDHVQGRSRLPRSSVMITFDDGYRDNYDIALPLLKYYHLPATFFISTEPIMNREVCWWDTIAYLIKHCRLPQFTLCGRTWTPTSRRNEVIHELQHWMRTQRAECTVNFVKELSIACQVALPDLALSSPQLMSWDQIREATYSGVTIGSHTHTHRVLSTLNLAEQAKEFRNSKQILEHQLGLPVRSVAYPVGGHTDQHVETASLAQKCGYELGFTFQTGANSIALLNPFEIGRISAEKSLPLTCAAVTLPTLFARSRFKAREMLSALLILSLLQTYAQGLESKPADEVDNADQLAEGTSNANTSLSPGFLIHIESGDDRKLTGDFRIAIDGTVALPYQVTLSTTGAKLGAFHSRLTSTYRRYFKGTPKLTVTLKERKYWIKVLGVVKNPGPILVRDHATLEEILALAQVRTEDLSTGFVRITLGSHTRWISMEDYLKGGHGHELPAWQGREVVTFQLERPEGEVATKENVSDETNTPSARKIQVLGEVRNPGAVSFQKNADAYYYLIQRGGPTQNSDLKEVELIRRDKTTNTHQQVVQGDLHDIQNLQEADILIVHPARQTSFERFLQNSGLVAAIVSAVVLTIFVVKK